MLFNCIGIQYNFRCCYFVFNISIYRGVTIKDIFFIKIEISTTNVLSICFFFLLVVLCQEER